MSVSLTNRQAEELHQSIIAYLSANNLSNVAETLREELGLEKEALDTEAAKRYETLLEKKWKINIRLEEKMMDLESRNGALETEIEEVADILSKRRQDPASLLPEARPRHCLESHRKGINGVAFHPVYTSIASCSDDCTTKIWDWELGELERTLKGHTEAVSDVDYGGPTGGTLLASCSVDRTINLWDPANEYINIRTFRSHDDSFSALRFIPPGAGETASGNLLVSASEDKILKIWDVTSGCCVRTLQGHTAWVRDVSPSPDGRFLLSTGDDMTALLWDISGPNPENKLVLADHEHPIECCAFAPHASYPHLAPLRGMKKLLPAVRAAKFVATGSRDNTIKIWDTQGTCLMTLTGHDDSVQALVFHPGGKYLLSASDDKTIRCWDLSQEGKCVRVLDAHDGFITCLRWAPGVVKNVRVHEGNYGKGDGKHVQIRCIIATGSTDSKLRIFAS